VKTPNTVEEKLMSYTKVVDAEVKQYGIAVAYTLEKMRSLCTNKADEDGWCFFTDKLAIETFGIVKHKTQWQRLIKEMEGYGLILVKKKATAIGRVNFYKLTNVANAEPTRAKFIKSKEIGANTFTDPKKAEKATKRKEIMAAQTTWQNTPDMPAPSSPEPAVEKPSEQSEILTKAYKRQVVPAGLHKLMDNGGEMVVCSNGVDAPLVVQSRFKMQVIQWCVENNVEYVS
jgi:hypothetical protein